MPLKLLLVFMEPLKRKFLELLEKDLEFRYAVAGYLGLSEVLKRLDAIAEEQKNLRMEQVSLGKEQVKLREEQTKIWNEIVGIKEEQKNLREEQIKLREEQTKIWSEIASIREEQKSLREEQTKIWIEIAAIKEEQKNLREEQIKLREDFNKMLAVIERMDIRLSRVERTLEKLTIDVEDEARSVIKHKLMEMGVNVNLTSLVLPELELDIYGVSDDVCVIGEVAVRAGVRLLDELLDKVRRLRERYPEMVREKMILTLYVSLPMVDLISEARKRGIWLLKATEEFHRPENMLF